MVSGVVVRELHEVGEYLQVVRLFGGIWGPDAQPVTIEMMRALAHAKANKITVATITQRPSLLSCVDKVLLLVNGTVALFGRRQDVLDALASRGISIESGSFGHQLQ